VTGKGKGLKYFPSIILVIFLSIFLNDAYACRCKKPSVEESLRTSKNVFIGKVTKTQIVESKKQHELESLLVNFEVIDNLKGHLPANVEIWTGTGGGDCGLPFKTGEKYLVFTSNQMGEGAYFIFREYFEANLYTDRCTSF